MFSRIVLVFLLLFSPVAAGAQGINGTITDEGISGLITSQGFSANTSSSPFPLLDGQTPVFSADFTTNSTTGQYYFGGVKQANFAAWMTSLGGTFARAGPATYLQSGVLVTATTGVPRFPTSLAGAPLGIRMTPGITNAVLQSNSFTTTWTLGAGSTPLQNVTGPDNGANTGWTWTAAAGAGTTLSQPVVLAAASWFSIFAKPGTSSFVYISVTDAGGTKTTWFNVTTGAVGTTNSTTAGAPTIVMSTPLMTQLANGWYVVGVQVAGAATVSVTYGQSDADASTSSTTGNTLLAFGAEGIHSLVQPSYQPDYIPTTTVGVAQAADDLHTTVAWFNATAGTLFVDYIIDNPGNAAPGLVSINDFGVGQNVWNLNGAATGSLGIVSSGNVVQWTSLSGAPVLVGVRSRSAMALAPSSFAFSKNGALPFLQQASGALPVSPTRFAVGTGSSGVSTSGNFRQVAYWNIRGSNAGIQALTSN